MGNTVARFAFRKNGSHLGRFAVVAVFLLCFFVSGAWAVCQERWVSLVLGNQCGVQNVSDGTYCTGESVSATYCCQQYGSNVGSNYKVTLSGASSSCTWHLAALRSREAGSCCTNGYSCNYPAIVVRCEEPCQADSVKCISDGGSWRSMGAETCGGKSCLNCSVEQSTCENTGGTWVPDPSTFCGYSCSHCDAQCECEESGGTWETSNGGYCVPQCQSQFCCDSLNQNLPSKVDTTWEGCVATDPANDRCVVLPTVENSTGSTSAECTAKSRYRICTTSYVWNRTAGQCAPISTNNCINQDVSDSRCTNVLCEAYQTRSVSALQYNGSTECYEGYQLVQEMMVCDNGIREERGRSQENFQVCDSYLEANNMTIQDYLSGQNNGNASVGGNTGGPSGGGGGSGTGSSTALNGGPSVNAQGDTVQNSSSPQLGNGLWTPQQQLVTSYDSTTGTTTIVQNSNGGDSVRTTVTPSGVRCLGVSGGVATLTNGYSTWTCEGVQSCSQAVISASINGGKCSASGNGVFTDNYNNDNLPLILDENGNAILTSENDNLERAMQSLAAVLNGIAHKDTLNRQKVAQQNRNHDDSLWQATFGSGLDAVRNMENYIASASSANSQAIAEASSANSQAISSAASKIATAVGNASADITGSIGNMKLNLREGIDTTNKRLDRILSASSQASSVNSQGFGDVVSAVNNARSANSQAISSVASMYRDSVHNTNSYLTGIFNALDTNGIIQNDLNKINSSIGGVASSVDSAFRISMDEWYNDKLKVTMDSNATRIVDALQVEVQLDSIKIDMPKDSTLDSIHADLSKYTAPLNPQVSNDTLDFGRLYGEGWDSSFSDTSLVYDSTLGNEIKSYNWIGGDNYTDSGFVDSVESTLDDKLDSTGLMYNARSDSMTEAYADTMMKYGGLDSAGRALNEFFASQNNSCQCFDVSVTYSALGADYTSNIRFSQYLCELKLFGELTAIDLMKTVLRIMTSIFCVFLLIRAIGQRDKK